LEHGPKDQKERKCKKHPVERSRIKGCYLVERARGFVRETKGGGVRREMEPNEGSSQGDLPPPEARMREAPREG